jgi:hypothetical protein
MLIELMTLAKNLSVQGIETGLVHRDFGKPGLTTLPTLRAILDENGTILNLLSVSKEDRDSLWTLKDGRKNFFPAVRVELAPKLNLSGKLAPAALKKKLSSEHLTEVISLARTIKDRSATSDVRLKQAKRMMTWEVGVTDKNGELLRRFASAYLKLCSTEVAFADEIVRAVSTKLPHITDKETLEAFLLLLVGDRVQLCFDFRDAVTPEFTLYSQKVARAVLMYLHAEDKKRISNPEGTCALTGRQASLLNDRYPDWSAIPVVNKDISPFSKFSDAKCNYRYRCADSTAFPVEAGLENTLVAALKYVTDQPPGINWCPLYNGKFEKGKETQDVLVAFPTIPIHGLRIASVFGRVDRDDEGRKQFQDEARPVCEAFAKPTRETAYSSYLVILLIRQISPGQIQLAYWSMPSIVDFAEAVESWNASGDNLPPRLRIPLPSKMTQSGLGRFKPAVMFPEEIVRLLSYAWIRDGTMRVRQEAPAVGSILDLFLRRQGIYREVAADLLDTLLARNAVLLTKAGHVLHRDNPRTLELWRNFVSSAQPLRPDYALSQTISLIGSLLYIMNSNVDNYKNESAFLVGKLLAAMDELHKCYCKVVRQGDIPNALIGNGLLGRASESPAQALAELSERGRIYLGWARSAGMPGSASEEIQIAVMSARKVLRIVAPLSERLHAESSLDLELGAVQKAHLFLGYLSPVLGKDEDEEVDGSQANNDSVGAD